MSVQPEEQTSQARHSEQDETPDKVPPKAWVTLGLFAGFVILFFTCATTFMFN